MSGKGMTTAKYREMAADAESSLAWAEAAQYWDQAIAVYPSSGDLAELDKKLMRSRAETCAISALSQKKEKPDAA